MMLEEYICKDFITRNTNMYNKENDNYGLYLAGLISENKYYELCEAKKAKAKKVKKDEVKEGGSKDVTGDGKADFADVMASRMIAGGMDKEEATKKAHAIHDKHKKKKKKKKKAHCYEATMPESMTTLRMGHGLDTKFKNFIAQIGKAELSRGNLKNLALNFITALHDAMVKDEKISAPAAKTLLMKDIKAAFMQADKEIPDDEK